jgi:hypothetical protein
LTGQLPRHARQGRRNNRTAATETTPPLREVFRKTVQYILGEFPKRQCVTGNDPYQNIAETISVIDVYFPRVHALLHFSTLFR